MHQKSYISPNIQDTKDFLSVVILEFEKCFVEFYANFEFYMGLYITSYLQVAKSFASLSDASTDKESDGETLELNFKCAQHYQEDGFISMIMFDYQEYFVVAILHRKMIERGSVHVPLVVVKWKTLPPKDGT
ncbi:hypothetical protein L195_g053695 [Trifolium pratense]|uniref:Uncharacterized protein n=1 Tax=Trifolium pratense TaxID=57577 RepID=A0A2K3KC20_TRIPR|nr:hypothetical protein L195_g053695 [Trifolium pratense]